MARSAAGINELETGMSSGTGWKRLGRARHGETGVSGLDASELTRDGGRHRRERLR